MEQENQNKHVTDPQQDEINGNIFKKPFEAVHGTTVEGQPSEEEIKENRPLTDAEKGAEENKAGLDQ